MKNLYHKQVDNKNLMILYLIFNLVNLILLSKIKKPKKG